MPMCECGVRYTKLQIQWYHGELIVMEERMAGEDVLYLWPRTRGTLDYKYRMDLDGR